jgi:hypothetical protein
MTLPQTSGSHHGKPCHHPRDLLIMGVITRATPPSSSSAAALSCSWRFRASCSFTVVSPVAVSYLRSAGHAAAAAPFAVMWPLRRGRGFARAHPDRSRTCHSAHMLLTFLMFLLAGGLTGFKKCTSTCIQTFAVASLISITWLMFGYSLAFGHNWDGTKNEFIGGANMFWFWGDGKGIPSIPACACLQNHHSPASL